MQAKLQHLQRKDEKRHELSQLTTVDFVMSTSSRNDVGDSWRITGFATWPTGSSACQDVGVGTVWRGGHQCSASPCSESCDGVTCGSPTKMSRPCTSQWTPAASVDLVGTLRRHQRTFSLTWTSQNDETTAVTCVPPTEAVSYTHLTLPTILRV